MKITQKLSSLAIAAVLFSIPTFAADEAATPAAEGDNKALAEKAAKELANPNTALAAMNFKFQYNGGYENGGDNFTTVFQPALPFPMDNGDKIIFRPAVAYSANNFDLNEESGFTDISFDLAYAPKVSPGTIVAFGMFAQLPTGSDGFTADQFAIGPEIMYGKASAQRIYGLFPSHLYGVAGDGADNDNTRLNKTSVQAFYVEVLGGGWTLGTSPMMSYDWEEEQATIPVNVNASKTVIMGGRPWKLGVEANYYVVKPDRAADFMIGFNITPVVENKLANLF